MLEMDVVVLYLNASIVPMLVKILPDMQHTQVSVRVICQSAARCRAGNISRDQLVATYFNQFIV